ncbi:MAG: TaqI-like C-terminal specificity domain-containing protein, partial [Candidatus Hodarchaeales archaeon]
IKELPNIKKHLELYSTIIENTLDYPPYLNRPRDSTIFQSPKIITRQRSRKNCFAYNAYDWFAAQDVYYIRYSESLDESNVLKALTVILNSDLAYFWLFWMGKRKGHQLELFGEPLDHFPINKYFSKYYEVLAVLDEYLTFLSSFTDEKMYLPELLGYFDSKLANALVNEMYFNYHDNSFSLLSLVRTKLLSIQFDDWEKEYYKNSLSENSNNSRQGQLEKTNIEIIMKCYNSLKQNQQIDTEIEKNLISFPFYGIDWEMDKLKKEKKIFVSRR